MTEWQKCPPSNGIWLVEKDPQIKSGGISPIDFDLNI